MTKVTQEEIETQQKDMKKAQTALATIKAYARSEEIQTRFENMLGNQAGKNYVESVIIAVSNDDNLQKCDPKSIMISAMRAASLKLSVDPALRQAHLVAYRGVCTLIPDYHGLVQLTVQTGMYIDPPNVSEVYKGETVEVNRFTGKVTISGEKTSADTIGWVGYFRDIHNVERYVYMTNEECDAHGKKYNPGGFASQKGPWATEREKMRRKTVLRQLVTKWGYYSPATKQILFDDAEVIEAHAEDLPDPEIVEPETTGLTEEEIVNQLMT